MQQLSQQVWLRTEGACETETVQLAFEDLVMQLGLLFQILTDGLTTRQINFLNAIINKEEKLTSQEVLNDYNLGTSANALKVKRSLHDKEIIDIVRKTIDFNDPLYKYLPDRGGLNSWSSTLSFKMKHLLSLFQASSTSVPILH